MSHCVQGSPGVNGKVQIGALYEINESSLLETFMWPILLGIPFVAICFWALSKWVAWPSCCSTNRDIDNIELLSSSERTDNMTAFGQSSHGLMDSSTRSVSEIKSAIGRRNANLGARNT